MENESIFLDIALSQLPRILGFLDDSPASKTFGCFDRYYWHYKLLDFPNSRFQEAVLVLSLAYSIDNPINRFNNSEKIRNWARAGIEFWGRVRHGDGSTDESYPFERHFCSTAYSLFGITEALLLFKERNPLDLDNTGNFIMRHNNPNVANQMAAAALALYNLYLLIGDRKYKIGYEEKLGLLFKMQDSKGFFREYGGFDIGYDSVTLSFLAALYEKTANEAIKESALKCIQNMLPLINNQGYFSPENMSRRTQFLYPFGFSVFNLDILCKIEKGLKENAVLNPTWLDDRYCIPLTANYMLTSLRIGNR